jgi:hypothetical protein
MSTSSDPEEDQDLEDVIKSVTSAAPGSAPPDTPDGQLMSILSVRAYDSVVRKSQSRARKEYQSHFGPELNELLANHERVQALIGTAGDNTGNWEIDPRSLSREDLIKEIGKITRKLRSVEDEIADLITGVRRKHERLTLVRGQNQKLEEIRRKIELNE